VIPIAVLFVVISGKVTWAVYTATVPTAKVGMVLGSVIGLFQNRSLGLSSVRNRPFDGSNLEDFLKFPSGANPVSCGVAR
jgi:hypothetical protein